MDPNSHVPYETLCRYLDASIEDDERQSVDRHLADCPYCRRDIEDARLWQSQLASTPAPSPARRRRLLFLAALALTLLALLGGLLWYASR